MMPTRAPAPEQRSLFGEILDWMIAPLLLLWPMSLGVTWLVAQTIASRPYDRELADAVRVLARQTTVQAASADAPSAVTQAALDQVAATLRRGDDDDRTYFQVLGRRGELLAGQAELAGPPESAAGSETTSAKVRFRDDLIGDEPVRVAWLWLDAVDGADDARSDALVQVAQTMGKRSQLTTEIIKGLILPQFVILPLAVVLVWFALARGIRPLADLQQRIRQRESHDLSAIPEGDVPDEVAPLVRAINDLLQRLDRSISTQRHFLADAAHQLKTPLAGLRMQAELAAREIDSGRADADSLRHALQQIARSTQRAAHTVDQLLAMARAEDAGQAMRRVPLDLVEVVREVVREFVPHAIERRIDLGFEVVEPLHAHAVAWSRLAAEPVLLGEMVRNLLDNALRYTPSGGSVTARVLCETTPRSTGSDLLLQVEDTGPGIPPAEREAIFRPFYRGEDATSDGSGLGLAIVKEVAQRHGASVSVTEPESARLHGATGSLFTVAFPLPSPLSPPLSPAFPSPLSTGVDDIRPQVGSGWDAHAGSDGSTASAGHNGPPVAVRRSPLA